MQTRVNRKAHISQMRLGPVNSNVLLQLFPFAIIIDHDMKIAGAGEKLVESWLANTSHKSAKALLNCPVTDHFKLRRPKGINFAWQNVLHLHTVLFELELIRHGTSSAKSTKVPEEKDKKDPEMINGALAITTNNNGVPISMDRRESQGGVKSVLLKGQMRFIKDIDSIVFLCSPL